MNDTILSFLTVLAVYGLSTLALPGSDWDRSDDSLDVATLEDVGTAVPEPDREKEDRSVS